MFALRRIAARAIAQPLRQTSLIPTTTRVSIQQTKPAFQRLFHQSWIRSSDSPAEGIKAETDGAEAIAQEAERQSFGQGRPQRSADDVKRVVYVGNLFFDVTSSQLEALFASHGTIVNTRIVNDPQGLSRGFGYVEFAEAADAEKAIQALNGQVFQGRNMLVQTHVPRARPSGQDGLNSRRGAPPFRTENAPSKTLFIGNLAFQMSDKDLNDLFRDIRNVLDVRVAIDRRSGQPRGFAHADFVDVDSAVQAKAALQEKVVYGRTLRIDFSTDPGRRQSSNSTE